MCDNQFYTLLGVAPKATYKDITKAYRKKAMVLHPDKGGDVKEFSELCRIYAVLSDVQLRQLYDEGGEKAMKDAENSGSGEFF